MSLKIHAFPPSPRSFKVLWLANYLDVPYEFRLVDLTKGAQRTPGMAALNPNQRAPVVEEDGFSLWESNAILMFLAAKKPSAGLFPDDLQQRMKTAQWMFWESAHWDPACAVFAFERVVKKILGLGDTNPAEIKRGEEMFARTAPVLDGQLEKTRYVTGDRLSLADFAIGSSFAIADAAQFPLEPYRAIARWRAELTSMPAWAKTARMAAPPSAAA